MYFKKIIKPLFPILLIIFILCLQVQSTFATTQLSSYSDSPSDIEILDCIGLTKVGNIIKTDEVSVNNQTVNMYTIDYGGLLNEVVILEKSSTKVVLKATENNKENIIEWHSNGNLYIDNHRIEVVHDSIPMAYNGEPALPLAGATIYFRDSVRYGTASDYSNFFKNENIANIKLNQKLSNLGYSALIAVMLAAMSGQTWEAASFGLSLYTFLNDNAPSTTYLSYKAKVYTHKNYHSGYIPSLFTFIYKYSVTYFTYLNYGGSSYSGTIYKYNMQG